MNSLYLLLVLGWLAALAPIVTGSFCSKNVTCLKVQRYTTKCAWWKCIRYRLVTSYCTKQVCCAGWEGPGCNQDVDECSINNGGCAQGCNNLPGSFRCECDSGYQLGQDGITCEDINECNLFNGGCQDICENTIGSFVCSCSSGELSSDGLSCESSNETSVFQRNNIPRKLLPRGCAVVTLTRCTEGADVEVRLSSTAEWYKLNSDPNVIFTLGIVFIEVNDIALPMSVTGMAVHNPNGRFMMKIGSLSYDESHGTMLATDRNKDCLSFNLTPRDVYDFIKSGSFLSTYLENIYKALPNWLKFSSTGFDILSINELKTDLLHGRDVQKVRACSGAPLFDNKLYSIFQFESGFNLSVYGNEISLPKPLNGNKFCLIVDICRAYGGTIFLMFPPGSRELLSLLKVISNMEEKGGFKLVLNGIGLSVVKEINVHYTASELTFWNGDEFFQYPVFPKAHMWLGGSVTKNVSIFDISAETDIYVGLPRNPLSLLTHVFLEEWNALVKLNVVASCTLKFKLFGKQRSIRVRELGVSSLETHMSVGGLEPRQWCGVNANPPGIFLSLRLSINPFRYIPILGNWLFDNRHTVYAFVTYDQSEKIKNLPTVDLINDILDIKQVVDRFMKVFSENLQRFKDLLSNTVATLLNLVNTALADLKAAIQQIVGDLLNLTFPDFSVVLDTIHNAWDALKTAAQNFFDAVEFNVEIAKHNFTEMIKLEVNRIKQNVDAAIQKAIGEVTSVTDDYSGFGVRYKTTIKVFGLEIFGLHLEFVYSVGKLGQCSRFQKVYQLLAGEKAARALAIVSTEQGLGHFLKLKRGAGIGAAFGIDSNTFILQLHAEVGLLGIRAEADVFISKNSLTTYVEGKVWSLFRARLTISAALGKKWYQLTYIVEGALLPGGSDSFDGSFLDALKKSANKIANEANKRITQAQQGLTTAKSKLSKAQNWLEKKKAGVRRANDAFDKTIAALERAKKKLDAAKGPFEKALQKLKAAEKDVDKLCKIKNCKKVCIPGVKCKWCYKKIWRIRIPYPCCKWTKCMIKIPDPICVAANVVCKGIRLAAYAALKVAKLAVKAPMAAMDVAKAAVAAAQIVVDKARVVLDIAEGALELAKLALEGVKATIEAAKAALEVVKFAVRAASKVFELIVTYGLQSILDVRQCGFRVELSTVDLPIFDVSCEVNAFRLGWRTVRIRINFKNILQSLLEAAKATIKALLNALKGAFAGRKRREIEFDVNVKMHTLYRVIRQTGSIEAGEQLLNETLDVKDDITGFKNSTDEDLNNLSDEKNRVDMFAENCDTFNEAEGFLRRVFGSLLSVATDSKASLDNVTAMLETFPDVDTPQLSNGSLASFGVNVTVGESDYNLTAEEMEATFAETLANITDDPELKEALGASTFAKSIILEETEQAAKMAFVEAWISVAENITSSTYPPDVCANFRDCVVYDLGRLYDLYDTNLQLPGVESIKGYLPALENSILALLNSEEDIDVNEAYQYSRESMDHLDNIKLNDVFCKTAPQIIAGPSNTTVSTGESVQFTCEATGDPTPDYSWFKDGEALGITSKTLRLESVSDSDAGSYSCRAENYIAGVDSESGYLTVINVVIACPTAFAKVAHPFDCGKFVVCVWSRPVVMTCPRSQDGQLVWDQSLLTCNYVRNVPRCQHDQLGE
ncbi:uncharacterized protein LOC106171955 [Lingula anatina]|uniref:Uncharacterized protein LOC106171955 n=1 Tax=Lingula anatina TaxID=7574 RepID=A0A1S3JC88_LINAN|nr:uncharacterized protein LOC106171955 [Lingula anatina]|eukprot:XP_013407943.1 uncharacterized protein LOC106171955 [Lingula anatina]